MTALIASCCIRTALLMFCAMTSETDHPANRIDASLAVCAALAFESTFSPARERKALSVHSIEFDCKSGSGDNALESCRTLDDIDTFYDALEHHEEEEKSENIWFDVRGGFSHIPDAEYCYEYDQRHTPQCQPAPPPPPPIPEEVPLRFIRAAKGYPAGGRIRYEETLEWRRENGIDTMIQEAFPYFETIKKHYPMWYHLRGKNNEPVYIEKPAKMNLKAMREAGVDFDTLLRYYTLVTEFIWQYIERSDSGKSITVIDLEGIGILDFAGEVIDFTRKASAFCAQHYPERAGYVFVVNVPSWFKIIWNVVKPIVDPVTLQKIKILRGKKEIFNALAERIPLENIPPDYGGASMPLGQAPEERLLFEVMAHNNMRANANPGEYVCNGPHGNPPCPFCTFLPARKY